MPRLPRRAALAAVTLLVLACATTPGAPGAPEAPRTARRDRSVLTGEDLRSQYFNNAYDAVQALRSTWLQARGADSFDAPSVVLVYLDNSKLGGVETLKGLNLNVISSIQRLDATEATARWGFGHGGGVILVTALPARRETSPAPKDP